MRAEGVTLEPEEVIQSENKRRGPVPGIRGVARAYDQLGELPTEWSPALRSPSSAGAAIVAAAVIMQRARNLT